jgi:voltage-gated potassium channel Kch
MMANIAIGLLLTAVTFFVHSVGLIAMTGLALRASDRLSPGDRIAGKILAITIVASGLVVLLGAEITLWAAAFLGLGVLPTLEDSLYFSTSTFATIGFGDIVPAAEWRLLASIEGVVGFLIIGWSAAYLVAAGIRFGPFEREMHF